MLVKAKCVTAAWDSVNATLYEPGNGPLPDGLYEIERDGPLASLKLGGIYVFDFDRNRGPDDKPHDYTCKKDGCGKKFKTLAELGRHSNAEHRDSGVAAADGEEVELAVDGRGKKKARTFVCKVCGDILPNLYALGQHNKTHQQAAPIDIEAETAVPA